MRREERVTVQGSVKKQQPDGMSHGGGGAASFLRTCVPSLPTPPPPRPGGRRTVGQGSCQGSAHTADHPVVPDWQMSGVASVRAALAVKRCLPRVPRAMHDACASIARPGAAWTARVKGPTLGPGGCLCPLQPRCLGEGVPVSWANPLAPFGQGRHIETPQEGDCLLRGRPLSPSPLACCPSSVLPPLTPPVAPVRPPSVLPSAFAPPPP